MIVKSRGANHDSNFARDWAVDSSYFSAAEMSCSSAGDLSEATFPAFLERTDDFSPVLMPDEDMGMYGNGGDFFLLRVKTREVFGAGYIALVGRSMRL